MLSKNNTQLRLERGALQRQRFGLRKLTIGVASVLLGTTFFIGGAQAATTDEVAINTPTTTASTTDSATVAQQPTAQTKTKQTSAVQDSPANTTGTSTQKSATSEQGSTSTTPITTQLAAEPSTKDSVTSEVATPTYSGMTNWEPNNQSKTWTGTASDVQYKAGDTANITYIIQSWGGTNVSGSQDFQGKTQYLLMIPAGFDTTTLTPNRTDSALGYQLQDLGLVGPNGERTFLLTLAQTPSYVNSLQISATITAQGTTGGAFSYNQGSPLLMPLHQNINPYGDSSTGGGTGSITLKNGSTYEYVRSLTSFNNGRLQ